MLRRRRKYRILFELFIKIKSWLKHHENAWVLLNQLMKIKNSRQKIIYYIYLYRVLLEWIFLKFTRSLCYVPNDSYWKQLITSSRDVFLIGKSIVSTQHWRRTYENSFKSILVYNLVNYEYETTCILNGLFFF